MTARLLPLTLLVAMMGCDTPPSQVKPKARRRKSAGKGK